MDIGLGPFCFRAMAYVIQADAKDFLRVWNDRKELHLIDPKRRRRLLDVRPPARAAHPQSAPIASHRSESKTAADIDNAIFVQESIAA